MILDQLDRALAPHGMKTRGGFHPAAAERSVLPSAPATVVLVGNVGGAMWSAFSAACGSRQRARGAHPLDAWTRAVIDPVAAAFGPAALYPFEGPPYHPFQRWARRALPLHDTPIGLLIDAEAGLWHAFRAALLFPSRLPLPPPSASVASPCATCSERPCTTACPVEAIGRHRTDVAACVAHVRSDAGGECRHDGCRARRACPVGPGFRYGPEQARFHMAHFLAAAGGTPPEGNRERDRSTPTGGETLA